MKTKPLSWLPRRKGDIYCAPACGCGCTYTDFLKATVAAEKLKIEMGYGWKTRVWENFGWHYEVNRNWTTILPNIWGSKLCGYTAFINDEDSPGGLFVGQGKTPPKALENVMKLMRKNFARFTKMVEMEEKALEVPDNGGP